METDDLIVLAREKAQHYTIPPHYSGCERDHLRCLLLMLADRIEDLDSQLDTALAALTPFAHPDLCVEMGGNVEGDNSPIYARNGALLRLGDFRRAAAAVAKAKGGNK